MQKRIYIYYIIRARQPKLFHSINTQSYFVPISRSFINQFFLYFYHVSEDQFSSSKIVTTGTEIPQLKKKVAEHQTLLQMGSISVPYTLLHFPGTLAIPVPFLSSLCIKTKHETKVSLIVKTSKRSNIVQAMKIARPNMYVLDDSFKIRELERSQFLIIVRILKGGRSPRCQNQHISEVSKVFSRKMRHALIFDHICIVDQHKLVNLDLPLLKVSTYFEIAWNQIACNSKNLHPVGNINSFVRNGRKTKQHECVGIWRSYPLRFCLAASLSMYFVETGIPTWR